jgi:hypothetical protein
VAGDPPVEPHCPKELKSSRSAGSESVAVLEEIMAVRPLSIMLYFETIESILMIIYVSVFTLSLFSVCSGPV